MGQGTSGWLLGIIILAVSGLILSLAVVWLNISRMDMGYNLKALQTEFEARESLSDKLRIERDNLLSPYTLGQKASEYGLQPATPGQIRRMGPGQGH